MESKPKNFTEAFAELEKLAGSGQDFKDKLRDEMASLEGQVKKFKPQIENQVKENPWLALGVAGLICLLLGWLMGSRGGGKSN